MTTTVFFDFESGGVEPKHPNIQLAAIAVRGGEVVDTYETKILFDARACDPEALKLNHYDAEVWAGCALGEGVVVMEFEAFLRKHADWELISKKGKPYKAARLAGHNVASFDAPRLKAMFERAGKWCPGAWWYPLDTLQLALWTLSGHTELKPANYQLGTLCEFYGIEMGKAHDALSDVKASFALARRLGWESWLHPLDWRSAL